MTISRRSPWTVPALVIALAGLALLVAGALLPWLENPSGVPISDSARPPVAVWASVGSAILTLVLHRRPRWMLAALGLTLACVVLCVLQVQPAGMCWDGVDADGNPVGGCEEEVYTWVAPAYMVGAALTVLGALAAWLRPPSSGVPAARLSG